MFICGNDTGARADVRTVLDRLGWDTADMGTAEAACAIEPPCMLWYMLTFGQNSWAHPFKLLRLS